MPLLSQNKLAPLGAHTSAAGGVWNALLEGDKIGATTVQLFTSNQRQWKGTQLTEEVIQRFRKTQEKLGLTHLMSHASYLINLGSPNIETLTKSRQTFREEIIRCIKLGITYLNFHPGAALQEGREPCLDRIIESLLGTEDLLVGNDLRLLIETTAGQGSVVGSSFEEIAYILHAVQDKIPVGVCIDTCHIFAAGYDIRTPLDWQSTLKKFDATIGLQHLYAFHLNDSVQDLNSRKDRHANLGEGKIGMASFQYLMEAPSTKYLPKYLETPGGSRAWTKEIALLKSFL